MSNIIQTTPQDPICFLPAANPFPTGVGMPSGTSVGFEVDNLMASQGLTSTQYDLGLGPRTTLFEWRGRATFASGNAIGSSSGSPVGATIEAYLSTSNSVAQDGYLANATGFSNAEKRRNLQFAGGMSIDSPSGTTLPDPAQAAGVVEIFARYVSVVWWNSTNSTLGTGNYFILTPIPDTIN